jgi:hypothetical protein
MRVPWRFLIGLPVGVAAALAYFIGAIYSVLGVPTLSSAWLHDITQEQLRLAGHVQGPRLLIVAGSSALFGINAAEIQRVTGCPTFNLGTHAGLQLDYRLDRLRDAVHPGDTILFAWEYEAYERIYDPDTEYDYILSRDPDYFRQMPLIGKIAFATRLNYKTLDRAWRNRRAPGHLVRPKPPYSPYTPLMPGIDCLDENGDEVFNTAERQQTTGSLGLSGVLLHTAPWAPQASFNELARFIAWAHEHRIRVLATFPSVLWASGYDSPDAQRTVRDIAAFYTSHGVPVVGTAQEAILHSRHEFLDSLYHLTHDAAVRRTDRLIPQLRPYLPARG